MTVPARRSLREGLPFHRDAEVGKVVRSTSSNIFGQSEKGIEYQHATDLPVHLRASAGRHAFRLILFLFDDKTKVDLVASRESNVPTQGLVELQGHRCAWIMRLYTERLRQRTAARRYADVSQLLAVRATRVPGARRRNCVRDILQR